MLPINRAQLGRDWFQVFTVLVWATVILIMFLAKLKAAQDVLIALILGTIFAIANADYLFSKFRFYKVFLVLQKSLRDDCAGAGVVAFVCLALHCWAPEAWAPGVALHLFSLALWILTGVQTGPTVSCGLWAGGRNQMTKIQLMLRVVAQAAGSTIAFAAFALYYSFKFPGQGPFNHFFGMESMCGAAVAFGASVAHIKHHEAKRDAAKAA